MAYWPIILKLDGNIPNYGDFLLDLQNHAVLVLLEFVPPLSRIVRDLFACESVGLYIGLGKAEGALELDAFDRDYARVELGPFEESLKVPNVLDLAGLGDSIAVRGEPLLSIVLHDLLSSAKDASEQEETADDGSSPSFPVVAMENRYSFGITQQIFRYLMANIEEDFEGRGFVVLPIETDHVL